MLNGARANSFNCDDEDDDDGLHTPNAAMIIFELHFFFLSDLNFRLCVKTFSLYLRFWRFKELDEQIWAAPRERIFRRLYDPMSPINLASLISSITSPHIHFDSIYFCYLNWWWLFSSLSNFRFHKQNRKFPTIAQLHNSCTTLNRVGQLYQVL